MPESDAPLTEPIEPMEPPPAAPVSGFSPFADLPKPGRKSESGAVPFDPIGYHTFQNLQEVKPEPTRAPAKRSRMVPKYSALETMYGQHPDIASRGKLRIERIEPAWYTSPTGENCKVKGILAFAHQPLGTQEFAGLFGGFRYRVFGMLEMETAENVGGPPQMVDVACAEFEIPVQPNLDNLPMAETDMGIGPQPMDQYPMPMGGSMYSPYGRRQNMMAPMPFYQPFMPQQQQMPQVGQPLEPVLNFAEKMMNRPQPMYQQASPPDAFYNAVTKQNESAQENMRHLSMQNAELLSRQLEHTQKQLEEERRRSLDVANKPTDVVQMVGAMSQLVQAQKGSADSEVVRQMRDDHERAMRRQQEDSERAQAKLSQDYDRSLAREREAFQARGTILETRIKDLENQIDRREREHKDEVERRERSTRDEFTRILDSREREHMQRVSDLQGMHTRELANVKEMYEREIRLQQTLQVNTSQTITQTHAIEMRSLQTDLAKLSADLEQKKTIVEQHMAEKNKPLLEQVQELQQMSAAIQQIAGPVDGATGEEGDKKWYDSELFKEVAKVALAKGADLLPKLAEAAKGQASPQVNMPPPQMGGPVQMRRLGPGRRGAGGRRLTFADSDGPPLVSHEHEMIPPPQSMTEDRVVSRQSHARKPQPFMSSPPPPPMTEPQQQMSYDPVYHQPTGQTYAQPQAYPSYPPAAQPQYASAPAMAAAQPQQPQRPVMQAAPAEDPWKPFEWIPLPLEAVQQIMLQFDQACTQKIAPEVIVDGLAQNYPVGVLSELHNQLKIERLIETIRSAPATKDSILATGRGRRWLQDVWAQIEEKVVELQKKEAEKPEEPAESKEE